MITERTKKKIYRRFRRMEMGVKGKTRDGTKQPQHNIEHRRWRHNIPKPGSVEELRMEEKIINARIHKSWTKGRSSEWKIIIFSPKR